MADDAAAGDRLGAHASRDATIAAVQEILSAIPAGCTWLVPIVSPAGEVVDFQIAAANGRRADLHGRGTDRVDERLSLLYPSIVDGPLWRLYQDVLTTGASDHLASYRYQEKQAGVAADSLFDVTAHRVLGGVLVSWQRLDEDQRRLERTELLGNLGWAEYDLATGRSEWSPGMYRIFERDPAAGPLSRAQQSAALLPDDRGLSETAWQTMDSGAASDVTVRFALSDSVKYLRVLSDVARDADGNPLKVYAVVQDVTARESSRSAIERLSGQLRTREMTALAEHRLAGQLQNLIQPVPREPFDLNRLEVMVSYLPAESAAQVGGDWYHAGNLPDGRVALAIGDVAGHGLDAATGMAHMRFALIAWLSIGIDDPGLLLAHMNHLCGQLTITATAIVALYDPATNELKWARAGHLAPLVSRAGATVPLSPPTGLLLGADLAATYPAAVCQLKADDLVLLYTDGLVERRGRTYDDVLEPIERALSEVSARPGECTLRDLQGVLNDPSPDDDTCSVALRILR